MKVVNIGRHKIELFNGIDELPTERFFVYNRMLLVDSGIGGDMEAIDDHIGKIMRYVQMEKKDLATQELLNMRNSFYFVVQNMNPEHLSFAALVYSIDGKVVTDFSDEALTRMLADFSRWGAKKGFLRSTLDAVKKKLRMN